MGDRALVFFSLAAACLIHAVALHHGLGFASAVTGDIQPRLRPLILADR